LNGFTSVQEIQKIVDDALTIGPMFEPIIEDLKEKGQVDITGEIRMKDLVAALYSSTFLAKCS